MTSRKLSISTHSRSWLKRLKPIVMRLGLSEGMLLPAGCQRGTNRPTSGRNLPPMRPAWAWERFLIQIWIAWWSTRWTRWVKHHPAWHSTVPNNLSSCWAKTSQKWPLTPITTILITAQLKKLGRRNSIRPLLWCLPASQSCKKKVKVNERVALCTPNRSLSKNKGKNRARPLLRHRWCAKIQRHPQKMLNLILANNNPSS